MIRSTSDAYLLEHYGHDKKPWVDDYGVHWRNDLSPSTPTIFAPHPSRIPSPDPLPFECFDCKDRFANDGVDDLLLFHAIEFKPRKWGEFEPDPNFTRTETNPILSAFRDSTEANRGSEAEILAVYIGELTKTFTDWRWQKVATPEQVESARRVLAKLRDVLDLYKYGVNR